jgi:RNA polymerase sigma factor (sigma-70 family)
VECCRRGWWFKVQDWQTIVTECGPLVWRTAYRLLGNHADAADCFQDTFLAALELSRRQPVRNLSGLLVRLATTRAIDRLRQRGRHEQCQAAGRDCDETGSASPADEAQAQELVGQLREAIGQLPAPEAKVFCLRYLSEMSYRQIASELGIGINLVGVSLYRAKARLREALGAWQMDEDEVSHEEA